MKTVLRIVMTLALAPILALGAPAAMAQTNWPEKPVKLVVGFTPGSATDVTGRMRRLRGRSRAPRKRRLLKHIPSGRNRPDGICL